MMLRWLPSSSSFSCSLSSWGEGATIRPVTQARVGPPEAPLLSLHLCESWVPSPEATSQSSHTGLVLSGDS